MIRVPENQSQKSVYKKGSRLKIATGRSVTIVPMWCHGDCYMHSDRKLRDRTS